MANWSMFVAVTTQLCAHVIDRNEQHYSVEPLPAFGQFSIVIHKAIDILKPNFQQEEFFTTSVVNESNKPIHRFGIPWKASESSHFHSDIGHYSNVAGPDFKELEVFQIDEPVTLFRASYLKKTPEGEMLYIRLVPWSILKDHAEQ